MDEKLLKEKLLSYIYKDFEVLKSAKGEHFFGSGVRPDLVLELKYSDILIVIELKNDYSKSYNSNELLRQAINYKHSKYDGKIPDFVFISTTKLMEGKGGFSIAEGRALGLAYKLGVGVIEMYKEKELRFKIGNEKIYTQNILTGEIYFDFTPRQLIVGTKAKSNRVSRESKFKRNN